MNSIPESAAFNAPARRKLEIIKWLAEGKRPREIADIIGVSYGTVSQYIFDMKNDLVAETTAALVAKAFRNGWIK